MRCSYLSSLLKLIYVVLRVFLLSHLCLVFSQALMFLVLVFMVSPSFSVILFPGFCMWRFLAVHEYQEMNHCIVFSCRSFLIHSDSIGTSFFTQCSWLPPRFFPSLSPGHRLWGVPAIHEHLLGGGDAGGALPAPLPFLRQASKTSASRAQVHQGITFVINVFFFVFCCYFWSYSSTIYSPSYDLIFFIFIFWNKLLPFFF